MTAIVFLLIIFFIAGTTPAVHGHDRTPSMPSSESIDDDDHQLPITVVVIRQQPQSQNNSQPHDGVTFADFFLDPMLVARPEPASYTGPCAQTIRQATTVVVAVIVAGVVVGIFYRMIAGAF